MPTDSKEYSIHLAEVSCNSFSLSNDIKTDDLSPDSLGVAHRITIEVLNNDNAVNVLTSLKYIVNNKDVSEITVKCRFILSPFSELIKFENESQTVNFEETLLYVIIPVAFSTTRGYYNAKLENNPLYKYPYPIIQTDALIKQVKIIPPAS